MGNNIKTKLDDFINEGWFKKLIDPTGKLFGKEETPDEAYQRQKREQEKEQAKLRDKINKPVDPNDPYDEEPDDEVADLKAAQDVERRFDAKRRDKGYPSKSSSSSSNNIDPYGEENWDAKREERDAKNANRQNARKYRGKRRRRRFF